MSDKESIIKALEHIGIKGLKEEMSYEKILGSCNKEIRNLEGYFDYSIRHCNFYVEQMVSVASSHIKLINDIKKDIEKLQQEDKRFLKEQERKVFKSC